MNIVNLDKNDIKETMELFCRNFFKDRYYSELFPKESTRIEDMANAFEDTISYCINQGASVGIKEDGKLIGFIICFDYKQIKKNDYDAFRTIFAGKNEERALPYDNSLHSALASLPGTVMYCVSLAVDQAYQRIGLASAMWDVIINRFPNCCFAADVSNESSLEIYRRRNFNIQNLDEDYFLITHTPSEAFNTFAIDTSVNLVVPGVKVLEDNHITYEVLKEKIAVSMCRIETKKNIDCFVREESGVCLGTLVRVSFNSYLKYQRAINVSHFEEIVCSEYVYYLQTTPYTYYPLRNEVLDDMVKTRSDEWDLIPDIFVSVPIQYNKNFLQKIDDSELDVRTQMLLHDMDFRTHYEAGIPSKSAVVDDLSSFKQRIRRFYLEKIQIQITCENTVNQYDVAGNPIGKPIAVDMFLSIDELSNCGVLTWYSLSAPFLISQLLDNIIRNQVTVDIDGKQINLFDYLNTTYGIVRRGTPKSFVVIPKEKTCLRNSQLASLLASETIYPDGETYGEIIDSEIVSAAKSELGMGQYSRAYVAAYTNVVLQFNSDSYLTLRERLYEESITLFYIELILFEEASIHIADREIIKLFTSANVANPVDFLEHVDRIYDDYSKTIDFWDIQVNYPTSQKSIDMLRSAFKIDKKLEYMKRNQEQLQVVFNTKCDIIDRKDSKRIDKSLALLSVFAVFSAWIDGYDYISTWNDVFSPDVIYIIQKILFAAILITAIYAVTHLFGGKIIRKINEKSATKKDTKNRKHL